MVSCGEYVATARDPWQRALVPNARWEKEPMSATELEGIRPFLKQLLAMKDQGLNRVGVVANFIRRRV